VSDPARPSGNTPPHASAARTPPHDTDGANVPKANTKWYWLLLLPYIAIIWLPSYNRVEPLAWGIPFFYWYQLLWVVLSTLVIGVVFHFAHNVRKR
jgi:hypothetical protein